MNFESSDIAADGERLVVQFAWYVDHFEDSLALDLFTEDTALEQPGRVIRGRDGVAEMLAARPRSRATRHIISNCAVHQVGESEIVCDSYITLLARDAQQVEFRIVLVADCHDRITRSTDRWRIAHRTVRPILPAQ